MREHPTINIVLQFVQDEVSKASAEFDEYLEEQVNAIALSPIPEAFHGFRPGMHDVAFRVVESVQSEAEKAVRAAWKKGQEFSRMKNDLKRAEYNIFLAQLGWLPTLANKYIKLAKTFSGMTVERLLKVEVGTLFQLCAKTYAGVVEKLQEVGEITQELVVRLMKEARETAAFERKKKAEPVASFGEGALHQHADASGNTYFSIKDVNLGEENGKALATILEEQKLTIGQFIAQALEPQVPAVDLELLRRELKQEMQQEIQSAVSEMRSRHIEMERTIQSQLSLIAERDATIAELNHRLAAPAVAFQAQASTPTAPKFLEVGARVLLEVPPITECDSTSIWEVVGIRGESISVSLDGAKPVLTHASNVRKILETLETESVAQEEGAFAVGSIVRHHKVPGWKYEVVGHLGDGEYQLKKFGEKGSGYSTKLKENQLLPL